MGINDDEIVFLTQEEQELFQLSQSELDSKESDDYKQGFGNAIMEFHRQYNIRSKKTSDTPNKNNSESPAKKTFDTIVKKITENSSKKIVDNSSKKTIEIPSKNVVETTSKTTQTEIPTTSHQKEPVSKEIIDTPDFMNLNRFRTSFNIEIGRAHV